MTIRSFSGGGRIGGLVCTDENLAPCTCPDGIEPRDDFICSSYPDFCYCRNEYDNVGVQENGFW